MPELKMKPVFTDSEYRTKISFLPIVVVNAPEKLTETEYEQLVRDQKVAQQKAMERDAATTQHGQ
jgi:hypothetical protein